MANLDARLHLADRMYFERGSSRLNIEETSVREPFEHLIILEA